MVMDPNKDIIVPPDARDWVHSVFLKSNTRTSAKMMSFPPVHEESLDFTFIEVISEFAAPVRFESEWIVSIDTHYLGGMRHFYRWEIADIGVLVVFRKGGKLQRTKVALLQSKRLYPIEQELNESQPADYRIGFGRLFEGDVRLESVAEPRLFTFTPDSQYKALVVNDGQYKAIKEYEKKKNIPIYYMLYHPWRVPYSIEIPLVEAYTPSGDLEVGCRVIASADLRKIMSGGKQRSPKYRELINFIPSPETRSADSPGWRIEEFIVDLVLNCQAGYVARKQTDEGLFDIFFRRSGPIAAAVSITFDAP
jgi:hypothetical protein